MAALRTRKALADATSHFAAFYLLHQEIDAWSSFTKPINLLCGISTLVGCRSDDSQNSFIACTLTMWTSVVLMHKNDSLFNAFNSMCSNSSS